MIILMPPDYVPERDYYTPGDIMAIQPPGLNPAQRDTWESACLAAERFYHALVGDKTSPEAMAAARRILPACCLPPWESGTITLPPVIGPGGIISEVPA